MKAIFCCLRSLHHLAGDRRGTVGIIMTVAIMPLIIAVDCSFEYAQLVEYQTALQDAVDNAALAGATVYSSSSGSSAGITVATDYINAMPLPAGMKLGTPKVSAASGNTNFNGSAYNVTVTASAYPSAVSRLAPDG